MGRQLRAAALLVGANLTDAERLALLCMADAAMDHDTDAADAGYYFAGWEPIAVWLGYPTYNPAAKRKVARALAGLRSHGYIKPVNGTAPRQRAAYLLTLPLFGDR